MAKNKISMEQMSRLAWLGLTKDELLTVESPWLIHPEDKEFPGLSEVRLMMEPDYLAYAVKVLMNIELAPIQCAILKELWSKPFSMFVGCRGFGKTTLLGIYILLKMLMNPNIRIVICGSGFRQSKIMFEVISNIWMRSPVLRSVCGPGSGPFREIDRFTFKIFNGKDANLSYSTATAIPLGSGIRGLRANITICDEFQSVPLDVYETVVKGFGSVSQNPIEDMKHAARRKFMMEEGAWTEGQEETYGNKQSNISIVSGTADYGFQHFAQYWKRYKAIIESRGDEDVLKEVFPEGIPEGLNYRDYVVVRIPYELIPEGFMDAKQVMNAKATINKSIFMKEYQACFIQDSEGFFKRSLIEAAVTSDTKPIIIGGHPVIFDAQTRGNPDVQHVIGIDPASEVDNFTIVIIAIHPDHCRIVHVWSINRVKYKERKAKGLTDQTDFYGFCARKIRDLMSKFPCIRIGLDSQGGGIGIIEALQDSQKILPGEKPIYPVIDEDKPKDTDDLPGNHIVEMINFADAAWTSEANNGLRKDFEDKALLFPKFDHLTLALSATEQMEAEYKSEGSTFKPGSGSKMYDSLEDCVFEIEDLKSELSTIVMTRSSNSAGARDRWDTPEIKLEGSTKKGRMHKDRYSALVIASMLSRQIVRTRPVREYNAMGTSPKTVNPKLAHGPMYEGPTWWQMDTSTFARPSKNPRER